MSNVTISTEGLEDMEKYFREAPEKAVIAAQRAINYAARKYGRSTAKAVEAQLNFKTKLYNDTSPARGRISVLLASRQTLTATVRASSEPLLLSKFAVNEPKGKSRAKFRGVTPKVQVTKGSVKDMPGSFYVPFKNGQVGLAIRLKKGESIRNRHSGRTYPLFKKDPSVQVLYGPSLDQAFATKTIDAVGPVSRDVREEFLRQLEVLDRGGK